MFVGIMAVIQKSLANHHKVAIMLLFFLFNLLCLVKWVHIHFFTPIEEWVCFSLLPKKRLIFKVCLCHYFWIFFVHLINNALGSLKQINLIMPCPVQRKTRQTDGLSSEQMYVHELGPKENGLDNELPWLTALRCELIHPSQCLPGNETDEDKTLTTDQWASSKAEPTSQSTFLTLPAVGISANQNIQLKNKIYEFHKIWAIRGQPFDSNFASIVCNALSQSKAPVPARRQIWSEAPAELKA